MSSEPKISVIIPIYNTAKYLPRCLDSILNNMYQNLEVICINDGSTDESAVILERYAAADSRIISVNKANAGVSAARNTGLDIATGDFIAFVDSDDWVHPQYFETLVLVQGQTEADIVICKYISTGEHNQEFNQIDLKTVEVTSVSNTDAMKIGQLKRLVWGRLYKRSSISGLRFKNGLQWGEDTVFSISSLCRDSHIALINTAMYYYFQRETSAMRTIAPHNKLDLARYYMTYYEEVSTDIQREIYLRESIKQALSCRYAGMFNSNSSEQHECEALLKQCKVKMKNSNMLTKKEKLMFNAFICMPSLYRLFRIIDDPTLLQWEKKMKQDKRAK